MNNYTFKDIIKLEAKINLIKFMKIYGIEKTEDKIKELYWFNNKAKKFMLKCYQEILGVKSNE